MVLRITRSMNCQPADLARDPRPSPYRSDMRDCSLVALVTIGMQTRFTLSAEENH